ncbi:DUF2442 domain-containing protein, partial [Dysosmobacter welbionis]
QVIPFGEEWGWNGFIIASFPLKSKSQFMPHRFPLPEGGKTAESAGPQQRLPLPDGTAHKPRRVGIRPQGDDLAAQGAVQPQPLFVRQRGVAPVGVELD